MKKSKIFLALFAAVLVVSLSIGSALAYFTDYTTASGNMVVNTGPHSKITERYDGAKHATIHNFSDSVPVYVRAMVFSTYDVSVGGSNGWSSAGNSAYSNYSSIVEPDGDTAELDITWSGVPAAADHEDESFNIIVVYECVPVLYNANGDPLPANWTQEVTVVTEGGNS